VSAFASASQFRQSRVSTSLWHLRKFFEYHLDLIGPQRRICWGRNRRLPTPHSFRTVPGMTAWCHSTSPGYTAPGPFRELRSLSSCFGRLFQRKRRLPYRELSSPPRRAMHPYPWPSRLVRAPVAEMPHFGHIRFFKRKGGTKSAHLKQRRLALWCPPISGFLDRMARSPTSKGIIHDAYSHGCDGSTLFDWIGRRGSITLSSPLRWCSSSLRGSARGVVRLVHALSGRQ
jgi:hypothetical protein